MNERINITEFNSMDASKSELEEFIKQARKDFKELKSNYSGLDRVYGVKVDGEKFNNLLMYIPSLGFSGMNKNIDEKTLLSNQRLLGTIINYAGDFELPEGTKIYREQDSPLRDGQMRLYEKYNKEKNALICSIKKYGFKKVKRTKLKYGVSQLMSDN